MNIIKTSDQMPIGEFAKLCGTTVQTLRVYDKKGILKPEFIGPQGYRYYGPTQIYLYHTISHMKRCGCSLKTINSYLHTLNSDQEKSFYYQNSEVLLRAEIEKLEYTIQQIKATQQFFDWVYKKEETPEIVDVPSDISCLSTGIHPHAAIDTGAFSAALATHMSKFRDNWENPLYPLGIIITQEGIGKKIAKASHVVSLPTQAGETFQNALSKPITNQKKHKRQEYYILKKGTYIAVRYTGPAQIPADKLLSIFRYIHQNNLKLIGDSLVISVVAGINNENQTEYACAILMPVADRSPADHSIVKRG